MRVEVTEDKETCFALRHQVFVEEQGVPVAEEQDALDDTATHFLAWAGPVPVGTARVVLDGDIAKIGRVCVLSEARGTGLGVALIRSAIAIARQMRARRVRLGAQTHALGFYEKLGFSAVGPIYLDAGLDHRDMEMSLQ